MCPFNVIALVYTEKLIKLYKKAIAPLVGYVFQEEEEDEEEGGKKKKAQVLYNAPDKSTEMKSRDSLEQTLVRWSLFTVISKSLPILAKS